MNFYGFLYGFSILFAIFLGDNIWSRYKNLSGFFFFLFAFFASLWNFLYFLFFSGIADPVILLYITRLAFAVGLISVYSLLFFIVFFKNQSQRVSLKSIVEILLTFLGVIVFFVFSPYVIENVEFSITHQVYREIYGVLYFIVPGAYFIFMISFFYFAQRRIYQHRGLDRIRIRNIVIATYVGVLFLLFLQILLPMMGIWILEKEIILGFLFFIVFAFFTITRYYFSSIGYGIAKFVIFAISFGVVATFMQFVDSAIQHIDTGSLNSYWKIGDSAQFIVKFFVGIIFFQLLHIFLKKHFLGVTGQIQLHDIMQSLQKEISTITDLSSLREKLRISMHTIFKIDCCELLLYNDYFQKDALNKFFSIKGNTLFINDFVFIEEHKEHLDLSKIETEVSKNDFLILPIHNTHGINIGILQFGAKPLGDFYTKIEIEEIKSFTFFLELHLKYIRTYVTMQDLSLNLDKKVDEKTIEYNDLINRQKEFIGVISHEIKSPLSSAIFQSDSIMDDLDSGDIEPQKLREELSVLNKQLVRTGGLISKLFSVQYYDTHTVNLFRETIEFPQFLEYELELFSHIHPHITFKSNIHKDIGFIAIDKIQLQQVINNLLDNAVKFLECDNPIIAVSARKIRKNLEITIEDNGKGFEGIELKNIFDKYTTGSKGMVGLGMGLYLCKKIISMHNGTIEASSSESYKGAKFTISIPII